MCAQIGRYTKGIKQVVILIKHNGKVALADYQISEVIMGVYNCADFDLAARLVEPTVKT